MRRTRSAAPALAPSALSPAGPQARAAASGPAAGQPEPPPPATQDIGGFGVTANQPTGPCAVAAEQSLRSPSRGVGCALQWEPMADAPVAISFWKSVAETFKSNPRVIFETCNEPGLDGTASLPTDQSGRTTSTVPAATAWNGARA